MFFEISTGNLSWESSPGNSAGKFTGNTLLQILLEELKDPTFLDNFFNELCWGKIDALSLETIWELFGKSLLGNSLVK